MKWSWRLGKITGIDVFVHWTFLILLGWIGLSYYSRTRDWAVTIEGMLFVLAIFACVLLHEFGHALMARRYGIKTRDIVLLPIGGVASLERMPEDPRQELAVAVAGPAVNVAIAGVLYALLAATGSLVAFDNLTVFGGMFWSSLMFTNIALVVFNLIPAFPMDGGRVLRALLATRLEYARATQVAAGIGQALAIVFGFIGLFYNPFLLLIALFVYLGAEAEAQMVSARAAFRRVPVREAMMTRFRTLNQEQTLGQAAAELLAGSQQDFPVVVDGQIVGVLSRAALVQGLAKGGPDTLVGEAMDRECTVIEDGAVLDETFQRMKERGCTTLPVVREGRLVGVLTLENIGEWAMLRSALQQESSPDPIGHVVGA